MRAAYICTGAIYAATGGMTIAVIQPVIKLQVVNKYMHNSLHAQLHHTNTQTKNMLEKAHKNVYL